MDRQKVVYPYSGILFHQEKELDTDTRYNMDEPGRHYVEWKQPAGACWGHMVHDSMDRRCPEEANS